MRLRWLALLFGAAVLSACDYGLGFEVRRRAASWLEMEQVLAVLRQEPGVTVEVELEDSQHRTSRGYAFRCSRGEASVSLGVLQYSGGEVDVSVGEEENNHLPPLRDVVAGVPLAEDLMRRLQRAFPDRFGAEEIRAQWVGVPHR